jgi:hypothetical protein
MEPDGAKVRYARAASALWRDAGDCVLTLLPEPQSAVVQLAGGSAALWRLLDRPRTLDELVAAVDPPAATGPSGSSGGSRLAAEVERALDQLVTHRLLCRAADAA